MAAWYRLSQFWQIVAARPLSPSMRADVVMVLSPGELALFDRFSASDQHHSYQVWHTLRSAGRTQADLSVAALLHDVGKTCVPLTIWDRTLIVLTEAIWPRATAVWGLGEARGWRRPFVVKRKHPHWGAEMVLAAGSSARVASLIRRHQDPVPETAVSDEDELLRWLQWADDQC